MALKYLIMILIGLGSGTVISGAVFAFIAIIGVVPRLAYKTDTIKYIKTYETAIILGGIAGAGSIFFNYSLSLGIPFVILFSTAIGIFYGCLAVSLAEVLNVIPILTRRTGLQKGIKYFIICLALGKCLGSLLYYFVPGFYY